jgi:cytochrome b pre-mRNA-processing protein 3
MKIPFLRRGRCDKTIAALYGAIVAQARSPALYRTFGVPDTLEGRLEMLILHLSLAFDRLAAGDPAMRALGQGVFDLFCQDMDDQMREMGVGDLAVPKRMRRVGDAFYGRQAAYRDAIADTSRLAAALVRNVYDGTQNGRERDLAAYVRAAAACLARQTATELSAGRLAWPDAAAISASEVTE